MPLDVGRLTVTVKLEGFETSDGTPLEPLVRELCGDGEEHSGTWRRTDEGFEIDLPVKLVPEHG